MRKINEISKVYLRKEVNKHSWNHFVALSSSTSHQFGGKFCFDLEISCCAHVKLGLFFLLTTETYYWDRITTLAENIFGPCRLVGMHNARLIGPYVWCTRGPLSQFFFQLRMTETFSSYLLAETSRALCWELSRRAQLSIKIPLRGNLVKCVKKVTKNNFIRA